MCSRLRDREGRGDEDPARVERPFKRSASEADMKERGRGKAGRGCRQRGAEQEGQLHDKLAGLSLSFSTSESADNLWHNNRWQCIQKRKRRGVRNRRPPSAPLPADARAAFALGNVQARKRGLLHSYFCKRGARRFQAACLCGLSISGDRTNGSRESPHGFAKQSHDGISYR